MGLRSIDSPRRRPAPHSALLISGSGESHRHVFLPRTLIVAVKDNCDGCQAFLTHPEPTFAGWQLLLISKDVFATPLERQAVWQSSELFDALEISAAPFYVALDGTPLEVVTEGVVFDPQQVVSELSLF